MEYIEALEVYKPKPGEVSLFLGGGISNCSNWQMEMVELLKDTDLVVLNPRRKHFPMDDPGASKDQIIWEFQHMKLATAIMFWFAHETLCPITLFEYGKWIGGEKRLFVGCHPEYQRTHDVRIQTALARILQMIHDRLSVMAAEIKNWLYVERPALEAYSG